MATAKRAKGTRSPRVSVIIPVYNGDGGLRLTLEALERQTLPRDAFEVLVVDNGSTVKDEAMRRSLRGVRWLEEAAPGSYAARNRGLQEARGEVLAFTDADTVPDPRWLERGLAALDADPTLGLVAGKVEVFARDPRRPTAAELYDILYGFPQHVHVGVSRFGVTANLFTRRAVVDQVGPFDPKLRSLGDRDWGNRVHEAGYALAYADDAVIRHPARASGRETRRKSRRTAGGTYGYLHKRWAPLPRGRRARAKARHWVRMLLFSALLPPWQVAKSLAKGELRPRRLALPVLLLAWSIMAVRVLEWVRLSFGGEPLR